MRFSDSCLASCFYMQSFFAFQVQEFLDESEPSCCCDMSESEAESNWHSGGMFQPENLASHPTHTTATNAGPLHVFRWLGGVMCHFMHLFHSYSNSILFCLFAKHSSELL